MEILENTLFFYKNRAANGRLELGKCGTDRETKTKTGGVLLKSKTQE